MCTLDRASRTLRLKEFAVFVLSLWIPSSCAQTTEGKAKVAITPSQSANTPATPAAQEEHWDKLHLSAGDLIAGSPVPGEKATFPEFTRDLLQVQWRGGDPIELYVIRPIGVKNPPVVLYLYGYPQDSDRFLNNELCRNLVKNGFAAVGFTSALTGQRYHNRPLKQWFVSELQESLGASVHDVQMILNYLATRGDLDINHVGMFGQGSGGAIAILSAAVDSRIKAVDVLDPWGDWPDWIAKSPQVPDKERNDYQKPEFLAKVAPLDPVAWLPKLADRPLRLQETPFNPASPEPVRKKIQSALPSSATSIEYKDRTEYVQKVSTNARMLDWIQVQLRPPAPPTAAPKFSQNTEDGMNGAGGAGGTKTPRSQQ